MLIGNALRATDGDELRLAGGRATTTVTHPVASSPMRTTSDPRMSRSLMRGLSFLTCFGPDGAERGIVELSASSA